MREEELRHLAGPIDDEHDRQTSRWAALKAWAQAHDVGGGKPSMVELLKPELDHWDETESDRKWVGLQPWNALSIGQNLIGTAADLHVAEATAQQYGYEPPGGAPYGGSIDPVVATPGAKAAGDVAAWAAKVGLPSEGVPRPPWLKTPMGQAAAIGAGVLLGSLVLRILF